MKGFQKPIRSITKGDVNMARISYREDRAVCSCGWATAYHQRDKITEDRIDRHLRKRHGGRGIRW